MNFVQVVVVVPDPVATESVVVVVLDHVATE